jgi:hypothetical protein
LIVALRAIFRPLRPDLDGFLFAEVGVEQNGIPLSMVSALTRLGLDPWDEAGRLSSLGKREATEQLARLIADLFGPSRPLSEAREIADGLVEQLPKHDNKRPPAPQIQLRHPPRWAHMPTRSQLLMFCLIAALVSIVLHSGWLPFGLGL